MLAIQVQRINNYTMGITQYEKRRQSDSEGDFTFPYSESERQNFFMAFALTDYDQGGPERKDKEEYATVKAYYASWGEDGNES